MKGLVVSVCITESMWSASQEKQLQRYTRGAERVLESRHLRKKDVNALFDNMH